MKIVINCRVLVDRHKLEKHLYQFYDYTNKSKRKSKKNYRDLISFKVNKHGYDRFFQDLISVQFFHNHFFIPVFGGF